jgi:putative Mn2+ efflux pump MntP
MISILSLFILICTISIDVFLAGFSIGCSKIKVPILVVLIICLINTLFLIVSALLGENLKYILSNYLININSPKKDNKKKKNNKVLTKIKCIFKIYKEPSIADLDHSNSLSIKELSLLTFSFSLDSIAAGIGIGIKTYSISLLFSFNFVISTIFFIIGNRLFFKLEKLKFNWSLLSGLILIFVGIYRLIY